MSTLGTTEKSSAPRYSAPLSPAEQAEFVPVMHALIRIAFDVIRPYFLQGAEVMTKADATPVTLADRGAEEAMRRELRRRYPQHGIVGEEFGTVEGSAPYRWVLDPVDGTKAFISNCFLFGTLIALERRDAQGHFRPVLGVIAHAAAGVALIGHRDATNLYMADGSTRPVQVRDCKSLVNATVLATDHRSLIEHAGSAAERMLQHVKLYRSWGDCFGYFALASGGADVMLDPVLAYWDVAAIVPVVEGAGGRVTSFRGGDPLQELSLIATAGHLHANVLQALNAATATDE